VKLAVYHNQPPGGARRALHGFGRELASRHQVDVFTLDTADRSMLADEDYATSVTRLHFQPREPLRMGFILNDLRREGSIQELDRVNARAAALIDAGGYEAVLVDCCRFTFAPQVLRHLRTPAVYYCHHGPWRARDVSEHPARSAYEAARHLAHLPFERRFEQRLREQDRELTRRAAAVAVNSEYTRRRVHEEAGLEATVCPPGITLPASTPEGPRRHVLTVGDLVPHKGQELVISALALLPAANRPALHLVGTMAGIRYREGLERLAREAKVDLVVRTGIDDAELEKEFSGAILFAYGARQEPLGLAPLEAMARRIPVVAVDEGGPAETVEDGRTGFLVAPEPAAMAGRIAELLGNRELRTRMVAAARESIEATWSWPHRAAALERVLQAVAVRRPLAATVVE